MDGLLIFLSVPRYPISHWSVNSGWDLVSCLAKVEINDLRERVKESNYIALFLEEVTTMDNTSWMCMHVYTIHNHVLHPHLIGVVKMEENTMQSMYDLAKKSLNEIAGMDDFTISQKLVCVGENGSTMMQVHRNGLCTKLKIIIAPYMVPIQCMVHILNLAFKIVHEYEEGARVDYLIIKLYTYF